MAEPYNECILRIMRKRKMTKRYLRLATNMSQEAFLKLLDGSLPMDAYLSAKVGVILGIGEGYLLKLHNEYMGSAQ